MEFKNDEKELNFIERQFNEEPCINVISKEQFQERVRKVFNILWEKLSKSFGPGGAGTFISVYPAHYNTKDGFTIMKNIAFDKKLDQVISDMVMTICNRLNFTVGDGTTTATIATKSIYDAYLECKNFFEDNEILPRDILAVFERYKNILLEKLDSMATPIRSDDPKVLRENIEKVVYISSNGNEEITNMIASLYEELMYPAISCTLSNDGTMKSSIVKGYKIDVSLTDKLYINNDNNTMLLNGSDVIIFDHKVMKETYEKILKPLSEQCRARGRHLVCIAPYYDETALSGVIRTDLNLEYRKNNDINLVLMVCSKATGYARTLLDDLAMLLNTMVVTPAMENEFLEVLNTGEDISKLCDIDNRGIEGITVATYANKEEMRLRLETYVDGLENVFDYADPDKSLRIGYCDKLDLGLSVSTFSGFYYDEEVYEKFMNTAKEELEDIRRKCEKIGTFSVELGQKQKRVYALGLKTGLIEVGSTSELSQGYLKDTVDDAVKAAASAYNNGVVLGCNVTLLQAIDELLSIDLANIDYRILSLLKKGFKSVYKTVFSNVFSNYKPLLPFNTSDIVKSSIAKKVLENKDFIDYCNDLFNLDVENGDDNDSYIETLQKVSYNNLYDVIISYSISRGVVLDLSTGEFNKDVINSTETDKEILKATIDLLSLLITGNQLVLC